MDQFTAAPTNLATPPASDNFRLALERRKKSRLTSLTLSAPSTRLRVHPAAAPSLRSGQSELCPPRKRAWRFRANS
jgi:hypothetical protein